MTLPSHRRSCKQGAIVDHKGGYSCSKQAMLLSCTLPKVCSLAPFSACGISGALLQQVQQWSRLCGSRPRCQRQRELREPHHQNTAAAAVRAQSKALTMVYELVYSRPGPCSCAVAALFPPTVELSTYNCSSCSSGLSEVVKDLWAWRLQAH
jgi:hypothetical protein